MFPIVIGKQFLVNSLNRTVFLGSNEHQVLISPPLESHFISSGIYVWAMAKMPKGFFPPKRASKRVGRGPLLPSASVFKSDYNL